MKLLAVTFAYHPQVESFRNNIMSYINDVDLLIVWNNSPEIDIKAELGLEGSIADKVIYMDEGVNVGIARAANQAVDYAYKNGYTHLLTMDQDSVWEDFQGFVKAIAACDDPTAGIFAPTMKTSGQIREYDHRACITSGMIVPVEVIKKVGLFREDYMIDAVDAEFCIRCGVNGYHIQYMPQVLIHSLGKLRLIQNKYRTYNYGPLRLYHIYRNNMYLWKEYRKTEHAYISLRALLWRAVVTIKNIIYGEDNKLAKICAIFRGFAAGIIYNPRKAEIKRLR